MYNDIMIFLIDERSEGGCINEYLILWTPLTLLYIAAWNVSQSLEHRPQTISTPFPHSHWHSSNSITFTASHALQAHLFHFINLYQNAFMTAGR